MYHFLDLTKDQVAARRLVLDKYGIVTQISALSVLFLVAIYGWLLPPSIRSARTTVSKSAVPNIALVPPTPNNDAVEMTHQQARERSPSQRSEGRRSRDGAGRAGGAESEERQGLIAGRERVGGDDDEGEERRGTMDQSAVLAKSNRAGGIGVWLDEPVWAGWRETRRQVLSMGAWATWLVVLVVRETGEDYMHITKRFAHVAVALFPFHYLLGTPSRLSPLPSILRVSVSSSYNAYHRLHGILLLLLLFLHATFYLNFYYWKGLGWVFGTRVVILGLCMTAVLGVLAVMSREKVRRGWRAAFVWTHVLGAGSLLVMLWFHVGVARWYVLETGVIYAAGVYDRLYKYRKGSSR